MFKPVREWSESDVEQLVASGRKEGPDLEYKQALWADLEKKPREFLRDICAMLNSAGGMILVGVPELRDDDGPTGAPDPNTPLGIELGNPEQALLQLESRVLDGIDPRFRFESLAIPLRSGRFVLAFQIPNSLDKPHRVFYGGNISFPSRRERRIYELNTSEIKEKVMMTASRAEVAESEIMTAVRVENMQPANPLLRVAAIPIFTRNFAVDLADGRVVDAFATMDMLANGNRQRAPRTSYSVDGLTRDGLATGVRATLGHNGLLVFKIEPPIGSIDRSPSLNPVVIDMYLRGILRSAKSVYDASSLSAPIVIGASLSFRTELLIYYGGMYEEPICVAPMNRVFPTLSIESLDHDSDKRLVPLCDNVHQSFGESGSPFFDSTGKWIWSPNMVVRGG